MNRQRLWMLILLALAFIGATILYFVIVWQEGQNRFRAGKPVPQNLIPEELLTDEDRIPEIPTEPPPIHPEDPYLFGSPNSPVTIIFIGDFQSQIAREQTTTINDSLRILGNPSSVRVIWKDMPLVQEHSKAMEMAIVGRCAARQKQFKNMHDLLFFETQRYTEEEYIRFARRIHLDEQEFKICLRDPAHNFQIMQGSEELRLMGVKEVPTLFVNGFPLVGYVDTESLVSILRRELNLN
ncbi:thioredoxin domain-containing protein [Candidatus Uhrbacteria bacterium]|nr:thioredoxin domain-containing protein [Candidatus Uhrbacteria bacterium]